MDGTPYVLEVALQLAYRTPPLILRRKEEHEDLAGA